MNCRNGVRAAQQSILQAFPELDVAFFIVWTPIFARDTLDAAKQGAAEVVDPRAWHFFDPHRRVGQALAPHVHMPTIRDVLARLDDGGQRVRPYYHAEMVEGPAAVYDTFFFYEASQTWTAAAAPAPDGWMTQLDPTMYVGIEMSHFEADLPTALRKRVETYLQERRPPTEPGAAAPGEATEPCSPPGPSP